MICFIVRNRRNAMEDVYNMQSNYLISYQHCLNKFEFVCAYTTQITERSVNYKRVANNEQTKIKCYSYQF